MQEEVIKRKLLSETYGRFDLLEKLFSEPFLMEEKPRTIIDAIIDKLDVRRRQIHYPTFYSWLWRYRSRNIIYRKRKAKRAMQEYKVTDPDTDEVLVRARNQSASIQLKPVSKID